jgi:putative ABC transport system substrate-binding protein
MRRREFITLFGGTAATWPLAARAQQPARRVYRVGYLSISFRERTIRYTEAFEQGLRSLGYHVGENVIIEYRFANGDMGRLSGFAAELVGLGLDIIMATGGNPSVVAAMKATTAIPIVMTSAIDPVSLPGLSPAWRAPAATSLASSRMRAARFWANGLSC